MQLIKSETAEREVRSIAYQMKAAKFPVHRDFSGFNFSESQVDVAVADWVRKQPFHKGKIGLVGFSRGGDGVLGMLNEAYYGGKAGLPASCSEIIDAAVAYYPGCHFGDRELRETTIPLLVNVGELDALTPL